MSRYPEFAKILNQYMSRQDRSATWLAQRLSVEPSTASRWLNGETRPKSPEVVIRIADSIGLYDPKERQQLLVSAGYGYDIPSNPDDAHIVKPEKPARIYQMVGSGMDVVPERLAGFIANRLGVYPGAVQMDAPQFAQPCGERGIDLGQQRLFVSSAFGTYFSGLLEQDSIHTHLDDQIELPVIPGLKSADTFQQLLWALQHPMGPRLLIIAAEGGMGKSTIAAKLIRCLMQMEAIDLFLGDSAKKQQADPLTGNIIDLKPGYYNPESCFVRLREQLALPPSDHLTHKQNVSEIKDRLAGRRTLIALDNLETVQQGSELLHRMQPLLGRDIRCIITTRQVDSIAELTARRIVVHLKPVLQVATLSHLLKWHVQKYQMVYPILGQIDIKTIAPMRLQDLIDKTGGIPLLLQLVFSEIVRSSWVYLDHLPQLWGYDLLEYLYSDRWRELGQMNDAGQLARVILFRIADAQYQGHEVDFDLLLTWAQAEHTERLLQQALRLLHERFLIVNHNQEQGNFSLFPSLADFVRLQNR